MREAVKFLKETLFPQNFKCDICGIETFNGNLCFDCAKTIIYNDGITCPVCGRKSYISEICIECKFLAPTYKKAVSALVYSGGTVKLISKFKNGYGYLKDYFADLIIRKLSLLPAVDGIVYVPVTRKDKIKRGFNQSELIAKCVSLKTNIPLIKNAVIKQKETKSQKSLSHKERVKNLLNSFKVVKRSEIKGKNILVIDDILTTGATADTISSKLLKAGASHIYVATVASVEYHRNEQKIN